ncbi:hypothetical protein FHETE_8184, partial [Fusarium heterosporum]
MYLVHPACPREGLLIDTPWSSNVVIKKVLLEMEHEDRVLYGVLAETDKNKTWDWLDVECLLWIFEDGAGLTMLNYVSRPSPGQDQDPTLQIDDILGHYETCAGQCYLAVKWKNSVFPTWEVEHDM